MGTRSRFCGWNRRVLATAAGLGLLSATGCVAERTSAGEVIALAAQSAAAALLGGSCGDFYLGDISSTFSYSSDSLTAGTTTGLTVEMAFPDNLQTPILSTYQVVITVPPEFTFLGFDALGAAAPIGAWEFDFFNPDGVFDSANVTIVHRSINGTSAYSDSDASGAFSPGVDPTADYTTGAGGENVITLTLPDGGFEQAFQGTMCSYFPFDARYTLLNGILRLPDTPGNYDISIAATSVDLDTGNATNNVPPHPLSYSDSFTITVPEPGSALLSGVSLATLLALKARRARTKTKVDRS